MKKIELQEGLLVVVDGKNKKPLIKKINNKIQYEQNEVELALNTVKSIVKSKKKQEELTNYLISIINNHTINHELNTQINQELKEIEEQAARENIELKLQIEETPNLQYIYINRIMVKEKRKGLCRKYLNKVVEIAHKHNTIAVLMPCSSLGTAEYKLRDIYKRIGFKNCNIIGIIKGHMYM